MLDIHGLMADLSKHRPIFHSEADFQHALALEIHKAIPDCEIRLELPYRVLGPQSDETDKNHMDIYLTTEKIAIELKYRTRERKGKWNNELFVLKNQSAHDSGRYGFLKDIERLDRVVADGKAKLGFAVLLTDEQPFWTQTGSRKSNPKDKYFRIYEGRRVTGEMKWCGNPAEGTIRGMEDPIYLTGSYRMRWRDYSSLGEGKHQRFRYLAVSVGRNP